MHFRPAMPWMQKTQSTAVLFLLSNNNVSCCLRYRLQLATSVQFEDPAKAAAHKALEFDRMASDIALVRNLCEKTISPVVFCHNDLLSGNIMVMGASKNDSIESMAGKALQLIDFEYGCYSYRGFDWGESFLASAAPACALPPRNYSLHVCRTCNSGLHS